MESFVREATPIARWTESLRTCAVSAANQDRTVWLWEFSQVDRGQRMPWAENVLGPLSEGAEAWDSPSL